MLVPAVHAFSNSLHPSFSAGEVDAIEGSVTAPMEAFPSASPTYVSSATRNSGTASFYFTASALTIVEFEFEAATPGNAANSLFLQVDDTTKYTWYMSIYSTFTWQKPSKQWVVTPGEHVLHVMGREAGVQVSRVKISMGNAHFSFGMCTVCCMARCVALHARGSTPQRIPGMH